MFAGLDFPTLNNDYSLTIDDKVIFFSRFFVQARKKHNESRQNGKLIKKITKLYQKKQSVGEAGHGSNENVLQHETDRYKVGRAVHNSIVLSTTFSSVGTQGIVSSSCGKQESFELRDGDRDKMSSANGSEL